MTHLWWIALAFFFVPLIEGFILFVGESWFHARFRTDGKKFQQLIIQITTVGSEQDRVNEIISEIRSYTLSMPYVIWVVNEPGHADHYLQANEVITVDPLFESRASFKARALEYSRRIRTQRGFNRADVKILFLDDDTSPTQQYIETAFEGDYDLCQGVTSPRVKYGSMPFGHYILSHLDDMRTLSCMIYCSFFQGVLRKPLYVHGEGLCVTGEAEERVTWDYPVFASEDLVFGQNAAKLGLRWGFFHEYIQLTSPWTWDAFIKQRRRWMWGNIHAITHRDVLPLDYAILVAAKYVLGFVTFVGSLAGVISILGGFYNVPTLVYVFFWASFAAWIGAFAMSGWVNSAHNCCILSRLWQTFSAVLLSPVTAVGAVVVLVIGFLKGNPKSFEVIAKTNG